MTDLAEYLKTYPKKYLIFDFDETLFTLKLPWHIYHQKMGDAMRSFNSGVGEQKSLNDFENHVVRKIGQVAMDKRIEVVNNFETNHLQGYTEHHQLTDFIKRYHQEYEQLFIWSSNSRNSIEKILKENELFPFFTKLVTKDDVFQTKPNPEGFEKFIYDSNRDLVDYVMIGNSVNDQVAAQESGIDFFLVDHTND